MCDFVHWPSVSQFRTNPPCVTERRDSAQDKNLNAFLVCVCVCELCEEALLCVSSTQSGAEWVIAELLYLSLCPSRH